MAGRGIKLKDLAAPLLIVLVIIMLVIPLPSSFISFLIAVNISMALLVVVATISLTDPVKLSVFPSLLLVLTLFRLAINISVTRLVLLHGDAGSVIHAFGNFVVGGNLVVGLVVFFILAVVQFIVITNGAGRVAEVAARFTLDGLPGKQMAIDVRVNSGQITDQEADVERKKLEREADFYGSMDGASKFVKGDAIAAVIITMINLVGGIAVGVLMQHLPVTGALHTFSMLTVGDGVSAMVPALLLSTATGLLVTRSASETPLGDEVIEQLASQERNLFIVAGAVALIGLVPAMPKIPFFMLAILLAAAGVYARRASEKLAQEAADLARAEIETPVTQTAEIAPPPPPRLLSLIIGYGLIPFADEKSGGTLPRQITQMRRNLSAELGFAIEPAAIKDDTIDLEPNSYEIQIRGEVVATGEVMPGYLLALNPSGGEIDLPGIDTIEPTYELVGKLVPESEREKALALDYMVIDPISQMTTHLSQVIRDNAAEMLSRTAAKEMLDDLKETNAATVEELLERLSIGDIHRVLQGLLDEGVPIRDLVAVGDVLADIATQTKEIPVLIEAARHALKRAIVSSHIDPESKQLPALVFSPALDNELQNSVVPGSFGAQLALDPARAQQIIDAAREILDQLPGGRTSAVVLCGIGVRRHLKRLLDQISPRIAVLSHAEIPGDVQVATIGVISV